MQTLPAPAAMEEFHEADVLWPDNHHHFHGDRCPGGHQKQQLKVHATACGCEERRPAWTSSAPVAIPVAVRPSDFYSSNDSGEFVAPHLVVARRRRCSEERAAASSMCAGQGRTLKGRDLQCLRTAVLRMTGFLET